MSKLNIKAITAEVAKTFQIKTANPIDGLDFDEADIDKDYAKEIEQGNSIINEQESERIVLDINYLRKEITNAVEEKWKGGNVFLRMVDAKSTILKSLLKGNVIFLSIEEVRDLNKQLRDKYYELNPDKKTTATYTSMSSPNSVANNVSMAEKDEDLEKEATVDNVPNGVAPNAPIAKIRSITAEVAKAFNIKTADFNKIDTTVPLSDNYEADSNPIFQVGEDVVYQGKDATVFDYDDSVYTLIFGDKSQVDVGEQDLMNENQNVV